MHKRANKVIIFCFLIMLFGLNDALAGFKHAPHDTVAVRCPKRISTSYGRMQMNGSKILNFFIMVILGGLIQLWIVIIISILKGKNIDLAEILSDGSLFFFSTALVYASWFGLANEVSQGTGEISFSISCLAAGYVSLVAIAVYGASAYMNIEKPATPFPPERYLTAQLTTAIVAISYSFYASATAGLFDREQTLPAAPRGGVNG